MIPYVIRKRMLLKKKLTEKIYYMLLKETYDPEESLSQTAPTETNVTYFFGKII